MNFPNWAMDSLHNRIVKVKRSRFYNIARDAFYSGMYNGSAIAADATTTTLAKLTVLPEASSYNTVNQAEYGIYTKRGIAFADYLHLLNVRYGAYCTQTPVNKSSSVSHCTITSRHIGIAFIANPGLNTRSPIQIPSPLTAPQARIYPRPLRHLDERNQCQYCCTLVCVMITI
ncbi:MAG: hypothetical protein IPN13_16990 [Bacteroidetes bacterium]|nr:hypothetical protein [Bacteroidota bacterium]